MSRARIICISVAAEDFARNGWRREYFESGTDAEAAYRVAFEQGLTAMRHEFTVELTGKGVAKLLTEVARFTGRPQ